MPYQDLFSRPYTPEIILQRRLEVAHTVVSGLKLLQDFKSVPEATKCIWFEEFVRELVWKHSEIRRKTKYIGCQFWSLKAANIVLERQAATGQALCQVVEEMQARTDRQKITHEHVYPIKQFSRDLLSRDPEVNYLGVLALESPVDRIANDLSRLAIGCIVLENDEHQILNGINGVRENPWRRYIQAGIVLVPNEWAAPHADLIHLAGIRVAGEADLDPRFL